MINRFDVMHSGILGMKRGVRRYQNEDGTWTEEGKAIRRAGGPAATIRGAYDRYKANRPRARDLSDSELSSRIERLRNEKTLKQLQDELYPSVTKRIRTATSYVWKTTRGGRKIVLDFAGDVVKSTGKLITDSGTQLGKTFIKELTAPSLSAKDEKGISDKDLIEVLEENKNLLEKLTPKSSTSTPSKSSSPTTTKAVPLMPHHYD